jgi:hypothetical protein
MNAAAGTPFAQAATDRLQARAKRLWEQDGSPAGQEAEFLERARELLAIEDNPTAGQIPVRPEPVEEASIQENLGEFPSRFTDQGDRPQTPIVRRPDKNSG